MNSLIAGFEAVFTFVFATHPLITIAYFLLILSPVFGEIQEIRNQ